MVQCNKFPFVEIPISLNELKKFLDCDRMKGEYVHLIDKTFFFLPLTIQSHRSKWKDDDIQTTCGEILSWDKWIYNVYKTLNLSPNNTFTFKTLYYIRQDFSNFKNSTSLPQAVFSIWIFRWLIQTLTLYILYTRAHTYPVYKIIYENIYAARIGISYERNIWRKHKVQNESNETKILPKLWDSIQNFYII